MSGMTKRTLSAAVVTAAVLAFVAGCGLFDKPAAGTWSAGPTPSASPGALPAAACELLTRAEVGSLTGHQVTSAEEIGDGGVHRCLWRGAGGDLAVAYQRCEPAEFAAEARAHAAVPGFGDAAYVLATRFFVLDGTVKIDVYVNGGTDAENLETAKTVALKLVAKL